jgi:transcriptional regulator with XRE-family HTH domain
MAGIEKRIGAKITEIRLTRKLTQAQLAEKVSVSVETVSRLERGVSMPSLKTLEDIAQALDIPLKSFFEFDNRISKNQTFERELSKLTAFLRTLSRQEITLILEILNVIFKKLDKRT